MSFLLRPGLLAAALALCAPAAALADYATSVHADSPAHFWRLDERPGAMQVANSAYPNHYGVVRSAHAGAGSAVLGGTGAFSFYGGVIAMSGSTASSVYRQTSVSFEAWARPGALGGPQVIAGNEPLSSGAGYALRLDADGVYRFHLGRPGASVAAARGGRAAVGHWAHLVGTHDGSALRLYVDGVLVDTAPTTAGPTVTEAFVLGRVAADGGGDPFYGEIDEVAVYGRALTAERIGAHHRMGATGTEALPPAPEPADTTAPVVEVAVVGREGTNGWYTSDVSVSFTVTDDESPVSTEGCDAVTVDVDTEGSTFSCRATSAGGTTERSVTVRRDTTAPQVALTGVRSYGIDEHVVVGCTSSDTVQTCAGLDAPAVDLGPGEHPVHATAVDRAGNTATVTGTVVVTVDADGLGALVARWCTKSGVAHALRQKLAHEQYDAFRNHVAAQAGKAFTEAQAARLIELSRALG